MTRPDDRIVARLEKIMMLVLAGEEGEAQNALAAIRRWMKRNNKDATWVLQNVGGTPPPMLVPMVVVEDWVDQLQYLDSPGVAQLLTDRELTFTLSLLRQQGEKGLGWRPSPRQLGWLRSIHMRIQLVNYQPPAP